MYKFDKSSYYVQTYYFDRQNHCNGIKDEVNDAYSMLLQDVADSINFLVFVFACNFCLAYCLLVVRSDGCSPCLASFGWLIVLTFSLSEKKDQKENHKGLAFFLMFIQVVVVQSNNMYY